MYTLTNTQTKWVAIAVAITISSCFLASLISCHYGMEQLESENKELWKQIGKLHQTNDELSIKIHTLTERNIKASKELDDVEALQRIQAQAIFDLKKSKKH
jgi:outer membrane murein-binding lipoprotein Lpp